MRCSAILFLIAGTLAINSFSARGDDWEVVHKKSIQEVKLDGFYGGIRDLETFKKTFDKAFIKRDASLLKYLLKHNKKFRLGFDLDAKDEAGKTYLHRAAVDTQTKVAKLFLEQGADPNVADNSGRYPLQSALDSGSDVAKILIQDKRTKIDVKGADGETPIISALTRGNCTMAKTLAKRGAEFSLDSVVYKQTALEWLIKSDSLCAVRLLAPDLQAANKLAGSPLFLLHKAAEKHAMKVTKYLLTLGVDARTPNSEGLTPFTVARRNMDNEMAFAIAEFEPSYFMEPNPAGEPYIIEIAQMQPVDSLLRAIELNKNAKDAFDEDGFFIGDILRQRVVSAKDFLKGLQAFKADPKNALVAKRVAKSMGLDFEKAPDFKAEEIEIEIKKIKHEIATLKPLLAKFQTTEKLVAGRVLNNPQLLKSYIAGEDDEKHRNRCDRVMQAVAKTDLRKVGRDEYIEAGKIPLETYLLLIERGCVSENINTEYYAVSGGYETSLLFHIAESVKKNVSSKFLRQIFNNAEFRSFLPYLVYQIGVESQGTITHYLKEYVDLLKAVVNKGASLATQTTYGNTVLDAIMDNKDIDPELAKELVAFIRKKGGKTGREYLLSYIDFADAVNRGEVAKALAGVNADELCGLYGEQYGSILEMGFILDQKEIQKQYLLKCGFTLNRRIKDLVSIFADDEILRLFEKKFGADALNDKDRTFQCKDVLALVNFTQPTNRDAVSYTYQNRPGAWDAILGQLGRSKKAMLCANSAGANDGSLLAQIDAHSGKSLFSKWAPLLDSPYLKEAVAGYAKVSGRNYFSVLTRGGMTFDQAMKFVDLAGIDLNEKDGDDYDLGAYRATWSNWAPYVRDIRLHPERLDELLKRGVNLNNINAEGSGILHLYAGLVRDGGDSNHRELDSKDIELIEKLISLGGKINQRNKWGISPLYELGAGSEAAARLLLDQGADPFLPFEEKNRPWDRDFQFYHTYENGLFTTHSKWRREKLGLDITSEEQCRVAFEAAQGKFLSTHIQFDALFNEYATRAHQLRDVVEKRDVKALFEAQASMFDTLCCDYTDEDCGRASLSIASKNLSMHARNYCLMVDPYALNLGMSATTVESVAIDSRHLDEVLKHRLYVQPNDRPDHFEGWLESEWDPGLALSKRPVFKFSVDVGVLNKSRYREEAKREYAKEQLRFALHVELPATEASLKKQLDKERLRLQKQYGLDSIERYFPKIYPACLTRTDWRAIAAESKSLKTVPAKAKQNATTTEREAKSVK